MPAPRNVDYEDYLRRAWANIDTERAGSVSRRHMMSYIPTLKATNPDIARHILETDLPLQVNWELFYRMCLHKRRVADLRKKGGLEVYDVIVEGMPNSTSAALESTEFNASLVLRDAADGPRLKSEVAATDPNIHHQAHRVEWRIPNMKQKTAAHVGVPPGKYCTSPPLLPPERDRL